MQGPDLGIELRIRAAPAVVALNYVLERREAAVVHVRRLARAPPQRRGLERAAILGTTRDCEPALIGKTTVARSHAGVVEALVSEIRSDMAGYAVALTAEH